jgi:hypothetical protein
LQSKYPPDIIGFCETIFHENISNDSLNINGFVQEIKDNTANCGGDILKVSFWLLLGVIKDIRKIAFKQEIFII